MRRAEVEFDDIIYRLQTNRGASTYWREVTAAIARQRPDWQLVHRPGRVLLRLAPVVSTATVFHSSLFRVALGPAANVQTVHDLTYEMGLVPGRRARVGVAQRRLAVRAADGLVFVSHHTRDQFAHFYPDAVDVPSVVAWHGRDLAWDGGDSRGVDPSWGLPAVPYLLHVGHRDGYKNFDLALAGYAASAMAGDGRPFVVLGPPFTADEAARIAALGLAGDVLWRDAPERDVLRRYLANSLALVYVSRQEGFGMPLIEAMQCRTPVIAADASCLPEVAGGAALIVDPDDPASLAAAIDGLGDAAQRDAWIERGAARAGHFTWEASAAAHLDLYEELRATRAR